MLWILHSTVCKAELRCSMYNVIFNQMDVYNCSLGICIGYIALVLCVCAKIRIVVLHDIVLQ